MCVVIDKEQNDDTITATTTTANTTTTTTTTTARMPNSPKTARSNTNAGSPRELRKFKGMKRIGTGAYGVVLSARDQTSNNEVAIKCLEDPFSDPKDAYRALLEVKLLRHFRNSKYIVNMRDVVLPTAEETFRNVYVVCELMDRNLEEAMHRTRFTQEQCKTIMVQLLLGLVQIHRAKVVHRDLRPKNILMKGDGQATKICDFGLGRNLEGLQDDRSLRLSLLNFISVRCYRAPEGFGGSSSYTTAVDVWALGCIFAELLGNSINGRSKPLVLGSNDEDHLKKIIELIGKPTNEELQSVIVDPKVRLTLFAGVEPQTDETCFIKVREFIASLSETTNVDTRCAGGLRAMFPEASQDALSLLSQMLTFDPSKRITAIQALKHPYFQSMKDFVNKELLLEDISHGSPQSVVFTLPPAFPNPNTSSTQEIKAELYKEICDLRDSSLNNNSNNHNHNSKNVAPR